jgi:Raf kinase inhibitor-like YbhB/YbcL family protein
MKKYSLFLFLFLSLFHYKMFAGTFTLESSAFKMNSMIPAEYTCDGADKSPPLTWHDVPPNTKSLVLIMNDPNAADSPWTHWVIFNIQPSLDKMDAGSPVPEGADTVNNSWNVLKYRGPCPPFGAHRYVFKLYALDIVLHMKPGATRDDVLNEMTGHVVGTAELGGIYQK